MPRSGLSKRRFRIRVAEFARELVSEPAGLDETEMLDGRGIAPAGYRHGVFAFKGTPTASKRWPSLSGQHRSAGVADQCANRTVAAAIARRVRGTSRLS